MPSQIYVAWWLTRRRKEGPNGAGFLERFCQETDLVPLLPPEDKTALIQRGKLSVQTRKAFDCVEDLDPEAWLNRVGTLLRWQGKERRRQNNSRVLRLFGPVGDSTHENYSFRLVPVLNQAEPLRFKTHFKAQLRPPPPWAWTYWVDHWREPILASSSSLEKAKQGSDCHCRSQTAQKCGNGLLWPGTLPNELVKRIFLLCS